MPVMPTSIGGSPARSSCYSWNRFGQLDPENGSIESPSPQPVEKPVRTVVPIGSCRWVHHRHGPHGCNRRACAGPGPGGPAPVPQVRTPQTGDMQPQEMTSQGGTRLDLGIRLGSYQHVQHPANRQVHHPVGQPGAPGLRTRSTRSQGWQSGRTRSQTARPAGRWPPIWRSCVERRGWRRWKPGPVEQR